MAKATETAHAYQAFCRGNQKHGDMSCTWQSEHRRETADEAMQDWVEHVLANPGVIHSRFTVDTTYTKPPNENVNPSAGPWRREPECPNPSDVT